MRSNSLRLPRAIMRLASALAGASAVLLLTGCAGLDFSPDGRQIVFNWKIGPGEDGLSIVNTDGTGFRPVAGSAGGLGPSWSPDGRHIAFARRHNDRDELCLYDTRVGRTRVIGADYGPVFGWREDGRRLAALRAPRGGKTELVLYSVYEGAVAQRTPLTFDEVGDLRIIWLPATDDVAIIGTTKRSDKRDIYLVEAGEEKRITTTGDILGMALSADGKKLLWARSSPNLKYILLSLYQFDLKQRSVVRLPFPNQVPGINPNPRRAPIQVEYVSFAPDSQRLAIIAKWAAKGGKSQVLYSLRMDGTGVREVRRTPPSQDDSVILVPAWSKDGSHIGLLAAEGKGQSFLAVYRADGSDGRRLVTSAK